MGDNKVPEDWSIKKIGDIGQVIGGGTPSTKDKLYYGGEIPWITPKDLSDHKFTFIERGERNITKIGLNNSSARLLPGGTVLFTSRAPIGYVAIAKNAVSTNQGFKSIICNPQKAYNKFIYYALKYYKDKIENVASGSTFKEISGTTLKNFEILLPPLDEQKVIADRLFSIDSKIGLNHQMNKTLEAIGQAIFKHWFVDFEFPDEEGKPYKSSGGEMIDSELGEIPKGWEVGKLVEIVEITSSKRIFQSEYKKEGIPFFRSKEIIELYNGKNISLELFISLKRYNEIKDKFGVPKQGEVLLTSVGTIGIPYLIRKNDCFYFKDGNLTWFKNFKENFSGSYVYFWLIS
jgi:type I restriction enzyme S subunit